MPAVDCDGDTTENVGRGSDGEGCRAVETEASDDDGEEVGHAGGDLEG